MATTTHHRLFRVKLLHTVVRAFFAGRIGATPVAALRGALGTAAALSAIVLVEVAILFFNGWRCPVPPVAARFTEDRSANFGIVLPEFVARYNTEIFGTLYVGGLVLVALQWLRLG